MSKQGLILTVFKYIVVSISIFLLTILSLQVTSSLIFLDYFIFSLIALFVGYLIADFLTGSVHWFCDTFFTETTPIIGPFIIFSFREHHSHPFLITEDKFIEQDTTSFFILLIPLFFSVTAEINYSLNMSDYYTHTLLIGLSIGAFSTNLFHKWAHMKVPPKFVMKLQNIGLILNHKRHKIHHMNHSKSFCVTSGLLNSFLDKIKFFQGVESFIRLFSYERRT
ncbi:uncharacterized protein METZ01_LOCUS164498 [marine metagenome]|uniref:Lipid desaturase domain-containing protein n=1 Tax=marine metagenome TaxID=408172 RepID=A0A382BDA5_9ZZZZ